MSLHTEWDEASTCGVDATTAENANENWILDGEVTAPAVLAIGGDGGGVMAIEGSRADLVKFAERVLRAAQSLPLD